MAFHSFGYLMSEIHTRMCGFFNLRNNQGEKMRSGYLFALIIAVAFSAFATPAAAQLKPYASVDASVMSLYLWRGMRVVDDPVFQPSVTLGYGGLSVNLWANQDLGDANSRSGEFTELDYTVDYRFSYGKAAISLGVVTYDFPTYQADATTEIYAVLGLDLPASPSITVYRDVDEVEGTYVSLGVGHSLPIGAWNTSLDLSASAGIGSGEHNEFYYGNDDTAFTDFYLGASMPFALGQCFSITPSVAYNGIVSGDIRDIYDTAGTDTDHFVVGITLSASF
jgi:hypothetical protein